MTNNVHFSSDRHDWETPPEVFDPLNEEFGFDLDVCATRDNSKCPSFFSPEDDGLAQSWVGNICWMNPPYGREIGHWVEKAHNEANLGTTVVALLPARTDTRWFHDHIYGYAEIRFIKGRIRFIGGKHSAPFPSMIVVWR